MRNAAIFIGLLSLIVGGSVWIYQDYNEPEGSISSVEISNQNLSETENADTENLVFDITAHSVEELRAILRRAEKLVDAPQPSIIPPRIALVLHGPEVTYFDIRNYDQYKDVVDLAARLDAFNLIDVKMCLTMMGAAGMKPEDVPAFIELVPYGPDEVERLKDEGYVSI
ncbi:MAG: hypothetical protein BMS9Abin15_0858 [Gammaproteobacteria bacterium]|nr:MAG: hypothetical protein BMS9Abin15_0858 [Gammaproteobacteria bacterium]